MQTDDLSVHIGQMARAYWDIDAIKAALNAMPSTIDDNFISRCANNQTLRRATGDYQYHWLCVKVGLELRQN